MKTAVLFTHCNTLHVLSVRKVQLDKPSKQLTFLSTHQSVIDESPSWLDLFSDIFGHFHHANFYEVPQRFALIFHCESSVKFPPFTHLFFSIEASFQNLKF